MSVWSTYQARLDARGKTKRGVQLQRTQEYLTRKLQESLSCFPVLLDGEERKLAIMSGSEMTMKTICAMPGESLFAGSIVFWEDHHWLVTLVDASNEVYTKGTMLQCNHLLKWIADDGTIVERWCVIDDGTKYLVGEVATINGIDMRTGDTRVSLTIARDSYTAKLSRKNRFLIDDPLSDEVLSYRLSKPLKLNGLTGEPGVYVFVLSEANTEDDDNFELRVADYYQYFPVEKESADETEEAVEPTHNGKKVWL